MVPLCEKQKAPLRLMSWCTYRMPEDSTELLQILSAHGGDRTTTDEKLLAVAQAGLPNVDTIPKLKQWLLTQLLCQVDGRVLPNYCGVLGEFLTARGTRSAISPPAGRPLSAVSAGRPVIPGSAGRPVFTHWAGRPVISQVGRPVGWLAVWLDG